MVARSVEELAGLRAAGALVRSIFERMKAAARPGVRTADLDAMAGKLFAAAGARSAPRHFYDFPGHTCISVNEEAAHGIPGRRRLRDGDMVNIDVSVELDGYVADMGESFVVGRGRRAQQRICDAVRRAVLEAAASARSGESLNVIGSTVQRVADHHGYGIVRNLGSHGVGRSLHEEPSYVPLANPAEQRTLTEGLVLTIEPFFTTGHTWVEEGRDGWTLSVAPGALVAQFEHTVIVGAEGAEIVTA
ncbi:MAG: type I methionyl aminopeptidase [Pseudomonadales bacterium]